MKNMNKKQLIVVALAFALLLLVGGTYAYFSINATSDKTGAKVTGKANSLGNPTMQIKTSKLYLNLDANLMSQANAGKTYYANENESGLALETNPNYVLATASLPEGDAPLDCTYNYKVTATVTTPITDNSDSNVVVTVSNKTMTLKELTAAGTTGIIVSGNIKNLTKGQSVSIALTSSVTNTANTQDKLVGNSYTINIEPYTNGDTKAFSCKLAYQIDKAKTFAQNLVDSKWLYQTNLENDGYRYVGTNPDNYVCFGTTSKSECTATQDKYMYRIIGVFSDTSGNNSIKLIKYKQLMSVKWNDTDTDVNWGDSTLYASLNGSGFLTNTTYDYLQNTTWSNKIKNWKWSAVNTKSNEDRTNNPDYNESSPKGIYLNEMHKTSTEILCKNYNRGAVNCNGGAWTNPTGKIGLMYTSDYALSLGPSALSITTLTGENVDLLKTSWMHQSNNDTTKNSYEWTLSRYGYGPGGAYAALAVDSRGDVGYNYVAFTTRGVRPVFYLTGDTNLSSGTGSLDDPFILE